VLPFNVELLHNATKYFRETSHVEYMWLRTCKVIFYSVKV